MKGIYIAGVAIYIHACACYGTQLKLKGMAACQPNEMHALLKRYCVVATFYQFFLPFRSKNRSKILP